MRSRRGSIHGATRSASAVELKRARRLAATVVVRSAVGAATFIAVACSAAGDGGFGLCRAWLPDRLDAAKRVVAWSRSGCGVGRRHGLLRRPCARCPGSRQPHRTQCPPRALVCGVRSNHRAVEPVAGRVDGAVQRLDAEAHWRRAEPGLAMDGGLRRHLCRAAAGHGVDGCHAAGDGACAGAIEPPAQCHRRALCRQHPGRGHRCAGHGVLAGAADWLGANRRLVRDAQHRLRGCGADVEARHCARPAGAKRAEGIANARPACGDRSARHRLRSAGGSHRQPTDRKHGLHLCDAAGGLPGGHGVGCGGLPALDITQEGRRRGRRAPRRANQRST